MVLFFTSHVVSPPYVIYVGEDKHENEELIRWGWPEDVWFHVDKLSSAHVYLRLHPNETVDDVPQVVLDDCAQLVKANSIQGCKLSNLDVVYTPWSNLKKTAGMEVGQVGFHRQKEVRTIKVEKKNEIVNRLNKTKVEKKPDLRTEREERDRRERETQKEKLREEKQKEKEEEEKKKQEAELRSYSSLMRSENMTSNQDAGYDSDDFM